MPNRDDASSEAVNETLPTLAVKPMSTDRAHQMRGAGWDGDLGEKRSARIT
jgi:hypothetical protein